ncbi:alpha/beta fold hydrolase [Microbacterium sp. Re1]|uniref:Alpha/beta fold hydrolase n=1 Tax=Microbacterium commune TaxID=2762219 RepID=A0ABR8W5Y6_9MICO|nr:alpha/beta hydrolase [Microbacterium commune]MBD8012424.1 alpha/beta fold hydrolase [Microbacterium commune]
MNRIVRSRSLRPLRRAAAVLAGLAAASLVLSGCLYAQIPDAPTSISRDPDASGVPAELEPYYSQALEWEACGARFDCTEVTAPRDWEDPTAGDLTLALIRHQATGEFQGSLLINPGGPGSSAYDFVAQSLEYAVGPALIERFDVIGFDPRGVGRSSAVACLDAEQMDEYNYGVLDAPRDTPEWEAEITARNQQYADACKANSDGLLPHITTVNSARDMDLIRAVLGDKTLNYLGYSYGTFLGATYAKLFPERAQRLVLDGAIDPSVPGLDVGTTQAVGFESALRAYLSDCVSTAECPFNGSVDEGIADFQALLATVARTPIENGDGRMLTVDTMITGVITAMYSEQSWPYLTQGLTAVLQGDPSVLFALADSYNGREPDGTYADNSSEAFRAYNCMDYPVEDDPAAEAAAIAKIEKLAPTFAPYWQGPDPCEVWPYPPVGVREPIAATGSGPIVVVGTTNDPATPYEWSESLAQQLENGVLVTRVGEGHTGYNKGSSCVDDAVESFLIDGTVPDDGLRCE